jgi:putative membrane protein
MKTHTTQTGRALIDNYTNHAANERTYLAWVRTGLAVAAFGFFVEKLNLLASSVAPAGPTQTPAHGAPAAFFASFGRYDGVVLSAFGIAIILLAGIRFFRTAREIDRSDPRIQRGAWIELTLSGAIALAVATFCTFLSTQ